MFRVKGSLVEAESALLCLTGSKVMPSETILGRMGWLRIIRYNDYHPNTIKQRQRKDPNMLKTDIQDMREYSVIGGSAPTARAHRGCDNKLTQNV